MHEVSVAQALLDKVIEECLNSGYKSVRSVKVDIGRASGVVSDALFFAYNALKSDTIAGESSLIINEIDIAARCDDCQKEFTTQEKYVYECPFCSSWRFTILKGKELNLIEIEVD
ncbi:MAG: hydrogenase maturation nickel metallochaperone HypA [Thermodesulfovibrionales bacterium]|nr:hydrogenase maturation nickel metallochaperone HypA [Thermodesulfovibrionales bacterium]